MSETDKDILRVIGVIVLIIGLLVFGIWRLDQKSKAISIRKCQEASERIGLPSRYIDGTCYIEIAEGLWVREYDVKYNLEHVDQERIAR